MAARSIFVLLLSAGRAAAAAAPPPEDPSCVADGAGECRGHQGASAIQNLAALRNTAMQPLEEEHEEAAKAAPITKVLAGVRVNIHGVTKENEASLAGRHKWVIHLPEDCKDEDVQALAKALPAGATALFEGLPSTTGLCALALEGTEAHLAEALAAQKGAELAEMDLAFELSEDDSLLETGVQQAGNESYTLPLREGIPPVSPDLLPKRPALIEAAAKMMGPYTVESKVGVPLPSYPSSCKDPFKVDFYYPTDYGDKSPLIVYGHGFHVGGKWVTAFAPTQFKPLASQGFFVAAVQNGAKALCALSLDMVHIIHWLKTAGGQYKSKIDFGNVAVSGYSMGSRQALDIGANHGLVKRYNIKASVALMPHCHHGCPMQLVPAFYFAGSRDATCAPVYVKKAFETAKELDYKPVMFKEVDGAHLEPTPYGKSRYMEEAIGFYRCYLMGSGKDCDAVKATECKGGRTRDCALLSSDWPAQSAFGERVDAGKFTAVVGCPEKKKGKKLKQLGPFQTAGVRCCNKQGKCLNTRQCFKDATWLQAHSFCKDQKMFLCPKKNIASGNGCCNKGCGLNKEFIWTKD